MLAGGAGPGVRKLGAPEPALSLPKGPAFGTWERPSSPARSQFTQKLPAFSPDLAKNLQNYLYFDAEVYLRVWYSNCALLRD